MVRAHHWATARWWAVGVLSLGTLALAAWLVVLVAAGAMAAFTIGILRPQTPVDLDVAGLVLASLPGLLVGWCVGLATTAVVSRGEALGPRTGGTVGALVGLVAGALVLRLSGLL